MQPVTVHERNILQNNKNQHVCHYCKLAYPGPLQTTDNLPFSVELLPAADPCFFL
uniref:Uncharacterized protein n=1 Tax=Arundo donax TaxID=35708 RepID=A0A0A9EN10_ARUDO